MSDHAGKPTAAPWQIQLRREVRRIKSGRRNMQPVGNYHSNSASDDHEGKAFSADPRLDKDAIYSSAKQEEDRLAKDPSQIGATARGNILRRTYDDGSKAFCDAQLIALRNAASAVDTAFRPATNRMKAYKSHLEIAPNGDLHILRGIGWFFP